MRRASIAIIGTAVLSTAVALAAPPTPSSSERALPILLVVVDTGQSEAWTMNADPSGAVAVCRQIGAPSGAKQNDCRHGTQSSDGFARLQALVQDPQLLPLMREKPASHPLGEFDIIVGYGAGVSYRIDRRRVTGDPILQQLAGAMTEAARRIGGEEFVPRF